MNIVEHTARFHPRAYSPLATFVATTEDVNDLAANDRDLFDRETAILMAPFRPQTFDQVWGDALECVPDEHVEMMAYRDNRVDGPHRRRFPRKPVQW